MTDTSDKANVNATPIRTQEKRKELSESLHARNHYTSGTEARAHLTEVVNTTLASCSDATVKDLHREYFNSPIIAKRIHTGFRSELTTEQLHELAVLTSTLHEASNEHLIQHVKALHTYSEFGLPASYNYALESNRTRSQCNTLITVSYALHGHQYPKALVWVEDTNNGGTTKTGKDASIGRLSATLLPRIANEGLIEYILEHPENQLIILNTIKERGPDLDLDLMRSINNAASSIAEGTL